MSESATGIVINIHEHGATVRLDDGTLAAVPAADVAAHRAAFTASRESRTPLAFAVDRGGRRVLAVLARGEARAPGPAPQLVDPLFEARMDAYLRSTEEWAPPDRPPPAERHFIRKKRRAAFFEARGKLA